jgi:hypothetical protein
MKIINLFLCLGIIAVLSGCKKDKDDPNSGFDINNPGGYAIFWKTKVTGQAANPYFIMGLLELKNDHLAQYYDIEGNYSLEYTVDGDKIVTSVGTFTIENGNVSDASVSGVADKQLIKLPATSAIVNNRYSGKYYKSNGDVLHNYFFYSFTSGTALAAGVTPGTPSRTGTYSPVANIGAYSNVEGTDGDKEFMILVNGKLEANYSSESQVAIYSGDFGKE